MLYERAQARNAMTDNGGSSDRKVYGRPPALHRFKKGRSGNPSGRPPTRDDVDVLLAAALSAYGGIRHEDGSRISKIEVALRRLVNEALSGNPRAVLEVLALARLLKGMRPRVEPFIVRLQPILDKI